jgi:hypothetical protein
MKVKMNYHATVRSINRISQHNKSNHRGKVRHQFNSRPGLLNNFIFIPTTSINNCLVNPVYIVNLNMELANLVRLPPINHKLKVNEPLVTLTPFLCFFLSPPTTTLPPAALNRHNMDYFNR